MSHGSTDIYGKPLGASRKPKRAQNNASSSALPFSASHARHVGNVSVTQSRKPGHKKSATPEPHGTAGGGADYLALAATGAFRKKGLGHQWSTGCMPKDPKLGPYPFDVQQARQRTAEEQLAALTRQQGESAVASVDRLDRTRQATSPPREDRSAAFLHGDPAAVVQTVAQRGGNVRPPMSTLPTLLHSEDPSYVDLYRNYLDDREARITAKQKVAYLTHDRFTVDPNTKLRTMKEERQLRVRSLDKQPDPTQHPEAFLPPNLTKTRHSRRTIEEGEEADTAEFARHVFCTELRKMCQKKPKGAEEAAASPSALASVVARSPTVAAPGGEPGPSPARPAGGRVPMPHEKQQAVRKYGDDVNLRRAYEAATGASVKRTRP